MTKAKCSALMIIVVIAVVLAASIAAYGAEDFSEAKALIDKNVQCSKLSEEQLERIGDYYMEQMHPGEQHELMDEMMGGENSESLKQMHIAIAKRVYCNDASGAYSYGMMGYGMMSPGLMHSYPPVFGYGLLNAMLWTAIIIAVWALVIFLVAWLIMKALKNEGISEDLKKKRQKRKR